MSYGILDDDQGHDRPLVFSSQGPAVKDEMEWLSRTLKDAVADVLKSGDNTQNATSRSNACWQHGALN